MTFTYDTNLSEFVSDYLSTVEGGKRDSSRNIAGMYIEACCTEPRIPTLPQLRAEVRRLVPQIEYYR